MWFRLLICTKDDVYANRLSLLLDRRYGDKTEVNIFSDISYLERYVEGHPYDVLLFGEEYQDEAAKKRWSCPTAVLVNQLYEDENAQIKKIAKYQRGDRIYHAVLDLYSNGGKVKQINANQQAAKKSRLYLFAAAAGGVGTTTIARAYAKKCAMFEKILYLDMGMLNFESGGEGQGHGLDDVLIALKSRRDILPMKLMSSVSMTKDRFYTYAACKNPMDMYEINRADVENLIEGIESLGEYQKVIVDVGTRLSKKDLVLFRMADQIVLVRDKSRMEDRKFWRMCELFRLLEEKEQISLFRKTVIFRNKTAKKALTDYKDLNIRETGWVPDLQQEDENLILERIAISDVFDGMESSYGDRY